MKAREWINENADDTLLMEPESFDNAIIGLSNDDRVIYSVDKILEILMKDMSHEEAIEYFEFNIESAYVGDKTPIYCYNLPSGE